MFEEKKLELRKFEIQVLHHAAYLFWNLKGVIAERWGHGPHFGAYGSDETRVTLTVRAGEPSDLIGIYGLKGSAFAAERWEWDDAARLATSWFHDSFEVLQPRVTSRMFVKCFYSYPVDRPAAVSQLIADNYPSLTDFTPKTEGWEVHGGLQFQTRRKTVQQEDLTSAIFGVYGPHQATQWFVTPDPPGQWALGLDYIHQIENPAGFQSPEKSLSELMEQTRSEARTLRSGSLQKTLNSVGKRQR